MRFELFIETPRLILRSWTAADRAIMELLPVDPGINTFCPPGQYAYKGETELQAKLKARLLRYQDSGLGKFIIELKETREFIGLCGVEPFALRDETIYELAYRLRMPYWSKGYGTEASSAMLDYVFNQLDLTEVHAFAVRENKASINIIQKLGFVFREELLHSGIPHQLFRLERAAWLKRKVQD